MAHNFICNSDTAVVMTGTGRVRGYCYDGISIFKGIPYAVAKRFHRPEPVNPWSGVWDATNYGFTCPLLTDKPRLTQELYLAHRYWIMNENCQNLNIWTPACDREKRPVLVWLHGGSFEMGSAIEQDAYEGEAMCRTGQVVVVSVNHRLNILGYCDLSDFGEEYANSGNAGTDDMIAALRWIRDNIQSFGGDPENVTLFGQSGGGAKITALLQSPAADGLFAKGINMSGVIQDGVVGSYAKSGKKLGEALMRQLGVSGVPELENVPARALAEAYLQVRPALTAQGEYVGNEPHPNEFYRGDPLAQGFRQESLSVPLMVGTAFGEFNAFCPLVYDRRTASPQEGRQIVIDIIGKEAAEKILPVFEAAYPERNPADVLYLDTLFRIPAIKYVNRRTEQGGTVYSYLFNQDLPIDGGRTPWHCADIPFVFHNTDKVPAVQQEGMTDRLENEMFQSVLQFARKGNPCHQAIPLWPPSSPGREYTMLFGTPTRLACSHDTELMALARQYLTGVYGELMRRKEPEIQITAAQSSPAPETI